MSAGGHYEPSWAPTPPAARLQFGDVVLVPEERLLLKNGRPVPLTPKAFDVLVALATNPGRLLTKDQLLQAVWGDTVVEEANLSYHVFAIRKALGDSDNGRFIETVPKRGYRFTAHVERVNGGNGTSPASAPATDGEDRVPSPSPGVLSPSLEAAQAQEPDAKRSLWSARRVMAAAVAVALIGVAFCVVASGRPRSVEPLRAIPLTSMSGAVRGPSLSPDGSYVVFSWTGDSGDNELYVQHVGGGERLRLTTDAANDFSPSWSPDGRSIAFLRRGAASASTEVRVIAPLGGRERKIADIQPRLLSFRPQTVSWCPDSRCLLVTDAPGAQEEDAVFVIDVDSGQKRQLTSLRGEVGADKDPVVSPDGRWLVFRRDSTPLIGAFHRLALGPGLVAVGAPYSSRLRSRRARPRGCRTAARSCSPLAARYGDSTPCEAASRCGCRSSARMVWRQSSPEPPTAASVSSTCAVSRIPTSGASARRHRGFPQRRRRWRSSHRRARTPSPTSPLMASDWRSFPTVPANWKSGRPTRMETTPSRSHRSRQPGFPRWSPDGRFIAFHGDPRNRPDVLVAAAGGGTPQIMTTTVANGGYPSFSRDGRWIYFCLVQDGQTGIWKMPATGANRFESRPPAERWRSNRATADISSMSKPRTARARCGACHSRVARPRSCWTASSSPTSTSSRAAFTTSIVSPAAPGRTERPGGTRVCGTSTSRHDSRRRSPAISAPSASDSARPAMGVRCSSRASTRLLTS